MHEIEEIDRINYMLVQSDTVVLFQYTADNVNFINFYFYGYCWMVSVELVRLDLKSILTWMFWGIFWGLDCSG